MAEPIAGIPRRPFREQIAAFRLRLGNLVPTAKWDDVWQAEHDTAFMVAGATKADLLADLAAAVDRAIAEGDSLEAFRRDFREIVERRGWHGWTGEGTKRGEAWRTRVIYRTNAATTYSAGRLAQLREGGFAYFVYRHGGSLEPRIQHLGWDGLVLPADHPFWNTHFPPNGWGCSCYVVGARSREGAERVGGDLSKELEDGWQVPVAKTGAPAGIDRGWAYAPGARVSDTVLALRDKLDRLPRRPSIDLIQGWLQHSVFEDWLRDPVGAWPLVRLPDEDAAVLGSKRKVADLSAATALKQVREHPDLAPADYALAQQVIDTAAHKSLERNPEGTLSRVYVSVSADQGFVLVVKATLSGRGLFVTSFRRLSREAARRDREIARLLRRNIG